MTLTLFAVAPRGAAPGERRCDGCRQYGRELREVRIPYSSDGGFYYDLCGTCIDRLRRMPKLPQMQHGSDRPKIDRAWDKALGMLREQGRLPPAVSPVQRPETQRRVRSHPISEVR